MPRPPLALLCAGVPGHPRLVQGGALIQRWTAADKHPCSSLLSTGVAASENENFRINPALEKWPGGKEVVSSLNNYDEACCSFLCDCLGNLWAWSKADAKGTLVE